MKNPITAIKNWTSQDKKHLVVSLALTTFILARAEMLVRVDRPSDLIYFLVPILVMTPFVWFFLVIFLDSIESFKKWIDR